MYESNSPFLGILDSFAKLQLNVGIFNESGFKNDPKNEPNRTLKKRKIGLPK